MTDLIAVQRIAGWEKLKALVLDSVCSPITKRVYNMALDEFMGWFQQAPRPPAEAQFGFLLGVPTLSATVLPKSASLHTLRHTHGSFLLFAAYYDE